MIKSEMSDGVENASLQTATTEETREENNSVEAVIDEGSELDEEKNESEIVKHQSFGIFYHNQTYFAINRHYSKLHYSLEKHALFFLYRTEFIAKD